MPVHGRTLLCRESTFQRKEGLDISQHPSIEINEAALRIQELCERMRGGQRSN